MKLERSCEEKFIFDKCVAWATERGNGSDGRYLRWHLGDCFNLIRFNRMTLEDFQERAEKYDRMFTAAELIDITQSITVNGYELQFPNSDYDATKGKPFRYL